MFYWTMSDPLSSLPDNLSFTIAPAYVYTLFLVGLPSKPRPPTRGGCCEWCPLVISGDVKIDFSLFLFPMWCNVIILTVIPLGPL